MTRPKPDPAEGASEILDRVSRGEAPEIERMATPSLQLLLPMRDGIRLETTVWLPEPRTGPVPVILLRTPYREQVLG
jgi:predicted acyl esterase